MPEDKNAQLKKIVEQAIAENSTEQPIEKSAQTEAPRFSPEKEKQMEQAHETEKGPEISRETEGSREPVGMVGSGQVISADRRREKEIEKVLAKDLDDIYLGLSPDKRKEFKLAGEKTAQEINTLLEAAKVKVKKIIELIRGWLSLVPGINRFFLEQETKIKTDEIMRLRS